MKTKPNNDEHQLLEKFLRLRATGSAKIRSELILQHQSLVGRLARRFLVSGEPLEDLIQEGLLGLIKAVDRFAPDYGAKFETYAIHTINGEIRHYLCYLGKLIQEPGWHAQLRYRVLKTREQLTMKFGYVPSLGEIAQALYMDITRVEEVLASGFLFELDSLDEPVSEDGDEESTMADEIASPGNSYITVDTKQVVRQAVRRLHRLQRTVIDYFFYQEFTKTDIARLLGVSSSYVSYHFKKALQNLQAILLAQGYEQLCFDGNGRGSKPIRRHFNRVARRGRNSDRNDRDEKTGRQDPERYLFRHLLQLLEHEPEKIRPFADTCYRLARLAKIIARDHDHFVLFAELRYSGFDSS